MSLLDLERLKREVILALFADNVLMQLLVLKGGNLLDIVYGISTRPSRDIDLSICGETDCESLRLLIEKSLQRWFEPQMYVVFDVTIREEPHSLTEDFRSFWGGYKVQFKIIDSATYKDCAGDERKMRMAAMTMADGSKKFPLDISRHEYVDEKVAELIDDLTVYAYSPQMLVAEKVRALCQQMPEYVSFVKSHQRMRGRDFLDIHAVAEYYAVDFGDIGFHGTVAKVFQAKRVDLKLLAKLGDETVREFHRPDFAAIAPTIRPGFELQDYDFYYNYLVEKCRLLEPLWHI